MLLEDMIFKKCIIDTNKLLSYGFIKEDNNYIYKKLIDKTNLELNIIYTDKISVKVMDLDFNTEYVNYRNDNFQGEFNSYVREYVTNCLKDIKNCCSEYKKFNNKQTDRIISYIFKKYKVNPEFLWDDTPDAGVFKKNYKKWFGIIMNIGYQKLESEYTLDTKVDIINVKINEDNLDAYLNIDGIFKAYHMNKKKWISITLDDALDDEIIFSLIDESYSLVK